MVRALVLAIGAFVLLTPVPAAAQAAHTWVSGVGDDLNPCSRTAPCKTWAGAIAKTAAGGEIGAIDPGTFGGVTITKSMTIDGNGVLASTIASGTNAVTVNAGPNDHVVLRNLDLNGIGDSVSPGLSGVVFIAGKSLTIENCVIANFDQYGVQHGGPGTLVLHDTVVRNASAGAVNVEPESGTPNVMILDSRLEGSSFGLHVVGTVVATVRDTHASHNDGPGFWATGGNLALSRGSSVMNGTGVESSSGANVRIDGMTVFGNESVGLMEDGGGTITAFSGELVAGNPPTAANTCGIQLQSPVVSCADATCPTPTCPQPACPQPNVQLAGSLGPCKKCKTKAGKTTCTGCPVNLQ